MTESYVIEVGSDTIKMAYIDAEGNYQVFHRLFDRWKIDSSVLFYNDTVVIGEFAKLAGIFYENRYVDFTIHDLIKKEPLIETDGKEYTGSDILIIILQKLVENANMKFRKQIKDIILLDSVYNDGWCRAVYKAAAAKAGLNCKGVVTEELCIADYVCPLPSEEENLLVYKLGAEECSAVLLTEEKRMWKIAEYKFSDCCAGRNPAQRGA